jgi:hypothetical protein
MLHLVHEDWNLKRQCATITTTALKITTTTADSTVTAVTLPTARRNYVFTLTSCTLYFYAVFIGILFFVQVCKLYPINTLRTGDANLRFVRFCVTTVKDG